MTRLIKSGNISETVIVLPSSKSISNRALILSALCGKSYKIANLSVCDDTEAMIRALKGDSSDIDVGAAGTAMRFLTAYLAVSEGEWNITGTERMKKRPAGILVEALRALGAEIGYVENEGFPPLHIKGKKLSGKDIYLDGSVSSQYISALLMIAPTLTGGLRLYLTGNVISRPYIDLTVKLMREFGVSVLSEGNTLVIPPQQYSRPEVFTVESDWSAASYWYELIALSKNSDAAVVLPGLCADSLQGDSKIVGLFDGLGVKTEFNAEGVKLTKKPVEVSREGKLFERDLIDMPDMAQTVTVTCAMLNISFRLTGLQSLKIKETDRLAALQSELRKLGFVLKIIDGNTLEWDGEKCAASGQIPEIATYEDHRMAMSFAPAAFFTEQGIRIQNPMVVTKSYPSFWDDLRKAGFMIID